MNLKKLIFGTLVLIIGYALLEKILSSIIEDSFFIILLPLSILEGIAYSIVILVAFEVTRSLTIVLLPITMALLNFMLIQFGTPFFGTVAGYFLELLGFAYEDISTNTFLLLQLLLLGAFGALIFSLILYNYSVTRWLTCKMYFLIAFLCSLSAISVFFLDSGWFLIINKAIWWAMFSLGIFIAVPYSDKNILDKATTI